MKVHDVKTCPVCKLGQRSQEAWDRGIRDAMQALGYTKEPEKTDG